MKRMLAFFVSVGIFAAYSSDIAAAPNTVPINVVGAPLYRVTTTTVIVIRHAEKNPPYCEEPETTCGLSANGEKRARALSYMLSKSGVSVVYSTKCNRTIETVNNYASSKGIAIQFYSPPATCTSSGVEIASLVNAIKISHRGKKILVVGHADTVPQILEALGVRPVEIGLEYDNLFVITIRQGSNPSYMASLLHLKYPIDDTNDGSLIPYN